MPYSIFFFFFFLLLLLLLSLLLFVSFINRSRFVAISERGEAWKTNKQINKQEINQEWGVKDAAHALREMCITRSARRIEALSCHSSAGRVESTTMPSTLALISSLTDCHLCESADSSPIASSRTSELKAVRHCRPATASSPPPPPPPPLPLPFGVYITGATQSLPEFSITVDEGFYDSVTN